MALLWGSPRAPMSSLTSLAILTLGLVQLPVQLGKFTDFWSLPKQWHQSQTWERIAQDQTWKSQLMFLSHSMPQKRVNIKKYMIIGKVFEFPSKPEQPGLSSSIRLEVTVKWTWYMQIWPIQLVFPLPSPTPQPLLLNAMENDCGDHCRGWGHKVLMYWNHIAEKIVLYNVS